MQPVYQNPELPTAESVFRTNLIIWLAMLFSQFVFLFVLYFAKPQVFGLGVGENSGASAGAANSPTLINPATVVLAFLGLLTFALSFVIKARLVKYAVDNSSVELVQSGHIVAWALCEATSIFGLVAALAFETQLFFLWFIAGIAGLALHFPRRESFQAAAFKGIK